MADDNSQDTQPDNLAGQLFGGKPLAEQIAGTGEDEGKKGGEKEETLADQIAGGKPLAQQIIIPSRDEENHE